ncbi:histidine phosphatase family protein [Paucisalibacillus globulus]|uniref:histidine phosphatase family protein n=1 Tax=Paucisalibacillus globulus TaxID=351095 RepID=UPI00041B34E4|nr:histidine phosphatase family protein [Paucisalibacillus globulus]
MGKRVYLVRHCKAEGQEREARLTDEGVKQAEELVHFFSTIEINRIITSPFVRAIDSIRPLANQRKIDMEIDSRLSERLLSTKNLNDWQEKLKMSFDDLDLSYHGGESSREAMNRGIEVIRNLQEDTRENIVIITHGNLMALLLKSFQPSFGYDDWKNLSNPDVYLLELENASIQRLWQQNKDIL